MTWDPNVTATVTSEALAVLAANLGTPLRAMYDLEVGFTERTRVYTSSAAANSDADLSAEAQAAVAQHFAQALHASEMKIGRLEPDATQDTRFTIDAGVAVDDQYLITINGIDTYHVAQPTPTPDSVATALAGLMVTSLAGEPVTVSFATDTITVEGDTIGVPFTFSSTYEADSGTSGITEDEFQTAASLSTELAAILVADPAWYGLTVDSRAKADILAAAAWMESNYRFYMAQTSDADCLTGAPVNVMATLKNLGYARTACDFHQVDAEFMDVGWLAYKLQANPDLKTTGWAYTPVTGLTPKDPAITDSEQAIVEGNHGNMFLTLGGNYKAGMGVTSDGQPIDVRTTKDWTKARLEEAGKQLLGDKSAANEKIPYTDKGGASFIASQDAVMQLGERVDHFEEGTTTVSVLPLANTPAAVKALRKFIITGSGSIAGAAERADITVFLSTS